MKFTNFTYTKVAKRLERSYYFHIFLVAFFTLGGSFLVLFLENQIEKQTAKSIVTSAPLLPKYVQPPNTCYGFEVDDCYYTEGVISSGQTLADLLLPYQISFNDIAKIAEIAKNNKIVDVRQLRPGYPYSVMSTNENSAANRFVVQPDAYHFCVFEFGDSLKAYKVEKPVTVINRKAAGLVKSNLWEAITSNDLDFAIAAKMEDVLGCAVNFHSIQKNDAFKIIFDEKRIEGQYVGSGDIQALYFKNGDNETFGYYYESKDGKLKGYFDHEGRPLKRAFLKAPVQYSRISSRFNLRRFHPVLKRVKAHLGTDFAAPYGTPILATASGKVTRAGRTRGNGNFVKINHSKTYDTQYLHMQKIAKGIRPGAFVAQGQVIGYVGSTGLATGPHVCYRFWKNGKQVNPFRQNLPSPKPMPESEIAKFAEVRDSLRIQLDAINLPDASYNP